MESSSSKKEREEQKQAEIRKQIALLQAQLNDTDNASRLPPTSPKRKQDSGSLRVPSTPSPKKRKLTHGPPHDERHRRAADRNQTHRSRPSTSHKPATIQSSKVAQLPKAAPSTVLQKLASVHAKQKSEPVEIVVSRSSAFSDRAAALHPPREDDTAIDAQARDDRLALVEDLVAGPVDHKPPFDDPRFEKLEPNSGIRLLSRAIPYDDFQDYLRGRYYLSPSKLYSVVRLLPSKQGYDVPVSGDWVTIAVVAERGKIKHSQAPVGLGREDKIHEEEEENTIDQLPLDGADKSGQSNSVKGKRPRKEEQSKPSGKKYVNMKLVDFGCRSSGSSSNGGRTTIRGDASLSLLLFEADACDIVTKENGKKEKVYRGGSRGAFEKMSVLREGAVVALLNPRILKPFQRSADAPHPTDNVLAITPESVSSIAVIGYSQDLGMCKATKRDGSTCGSWCDRRVADVCDWHIQHAVERKRAGRAEFSIGTSGMSTAAKRKKPAYDPKRQWGLKPEEDHVAGSATYVVSGHVVSGSNDAKSLFISETMGRDAQAKASRKASTKVAERALQQLLERDKEGTKALLSARKFGKRIANHSEKVKGEHGKKSLEGQYPEETSDVDVEGSNDDGETKPRKNAYSAHLIRQLGFDPTAKDGKRAADSNLQLKLDALAAVQASKRDIRLGPRPGKRNTCVRRPVCATSDRSLAQHGMATATASRNRPPISLNASDDDELEKEELATFGKTIKSVARSTVVSLDSSDIELEVEPPM